MLTWSKPNAIVPDQPLRWILITLRFYAIVAGVGMVLAFAVISILALAPRVLHHNVNPIEAADINRIEGSDTSQPPVLPHKDVNVPPIGVGTIDRVNAGAGGLVVLIAMCILFGAATYFTGRLSGKAGLTTGGIACVIILIALWALGGFGFLVGLPTPHGTPGSAYPP